MEHRYLLEKVYEMYIERAYTPSSLSICDMKLTKLLTFEKTVRAEKSIEGKFSLFLSLSHTHLK